MSLLTKKTTQLCLETQFGHIQGGLTEEGRLRLLRFLSELQADQRFFTPSPPQLQAIAAKPQPQQPELPQWWPKA